ncbi:MAG: hypothetical protein ACKO6N_16085 [Myxococcota bacterium]
MRRAAGLTLAGLLLAATGTLQWVVLPYLASLPPSASSTPAPPQAPAAPLQPDTEALRLDALGLLPVQPPEGELPRVLLTLDAARLTALTRDESSLWVAAGRRIFRIEPRSTRIERLPLSEELLSGEIHWLGLAEDALYLLTRSPDRPGERDHLQLLQLSTGALSSLPLIGRLEHPQLHAGQVWGWQMDPHTGLPNLWRTNGQAEREPLPSCAVLHPTPGAPLPHFAVLGNQVLVASPQGLSFWTEGDTTCLNLPLPEPRPTKVLGLSPWQDGFALTLEPGGLYYLPLSSFNRLRPTSPRPLDPEARLTQLTPAGQHLWGLEAGQLARYQGTLRTRVHYPALPVNGAPLLALVPAREGVFYLTEQGLYRWQVPQLQPFPVAMVGHAHAPSADDAEVEALIQHIARLLPSERRAAFERLLQKPQRRYDEVFLVGLNEDDPLILEVVSEYFRTHHPEGALDPLVDILIQQQGDKAAREHLVQILISFGPAVVEPVVKRLLTESADLLDGGARQALERVLVGAVEQGGVSLLNDFLRDARAPFLRQYAQAELERTLPVQVNAETFNRLHHRLETSSDPEEVTAVLHVLTRLAQRAAPPPEAQAIVPLLLSLLEQPERILRRKGSPSEPFETPASESAAAPSSVTETSPAPIKVPVFNPLPLRQQLLLTLEALAVPEVGKVATRLLQTQPSLRYEALRAAIAGGGPEARALILESLRHRALDIRLAAAEGVRVERVREALPILREQLQQERGRLCLPCVEAVSSLRDPLARPILLARLSETRWEEQEVLLRALTALGDEPLARHVWGWFQLNHLVQIQQGRKTLEEESLRRLLLTGLSLVVLHGSEGERLDVQGLLERPPFESLVEFQALQTLVRILSVSPELESTSDPGVAKSSSELVAKVDARAQALVRVLAGELSSSGGGLNAQARILLRPSLFAAAQTLPVESVAPVLRALILKASSVEVREAAALTLAAAGTSLDPAIWRQALQDPAYRSSVYPHDIFPVRRIARRALEEAGKK